MRKFIPTIAATGAALTLTFAAASGAAEEQAGSPSASASVVRVERIVPPRRKVVHHAFKPWAKPTARQVREIIGAEARRWHIEPSRLARRVGCESRFRWWASNGTYFGVLQFSPGTFQRGLNTLRDRRVKLVRDRLRTVHGASVTHYADGHVTRKLGAARKQRLVVVYTGTLPRRPGVSHAWAQLRIGSQAIRGVSAVHSSEWSCGA